MTRTNGLMRYMLLTAMLGLNDFGRVGRIHPRKAETVSDLPATKEYYLKKAAEKRRRKIERMIKGQLAVETSK